MSTVKVVIRPEPWEDLTSETLHQQQPNSHTKLLTSLQHSSLISLTLFSPLDCVLTALSLSLWTHSKKFVNTEATDKSSDSSLERRKGFIFHSVFFVSLQTKEIRFTWQTHWEVHPKAVELSGNTNHINRITIEFFLSNFEDVSSGPDMASRWPGPTQVLKRREHGDYLVIMSHLTIVKC